MSERKPDERAFEKHIEEQLCNSGYQKVDPSKYDKTLCLIPDELIAFIKDTQPKSYEKLQTYCGSNTDTVLTKRISSEISSRGVLDVFRLEVKEQGCKFKLFYPQPKSGLNPEHEKLYKKNRFITVRQLKYSTKNENSIDMGIFLNGIPLMMLELKNSLTGQTHLNAMSQWKKDRDSREPLFKYKRNLVYFAVGNEKVYMTTRLKNSQTVFLPFNKDITNPVNPNGHKTHYLWDEVLQPDSVVDLIESFAYIRTENEKVFDAKKNKVVDKPSENLIFPRYHQLKVIRKLKADVRKYGVGKNYLIQHATGSGKSLSIAWLSHLLSSIYQTNDSENRIFDSVIVVTDRVVLDKQISDAIKQLERSKGVVCDVKEGSSQLKEYLESGKSIIVSTIQKFPYISKEVASMKGKKFAIIIDEVHSSQSGENAKHLKKALSDKTLDECSEGEGSEDITEVDKKVLDEIKNRGKQPHISYFGFSGTPKNKTLELFGTKTSEGYKPFDLYSMKQSIAEEFTLDVLQNYTTYKRYFKLNHTAKEDKEFPESRVKSALMKWVDLHPHSIREKTQIILEHFVNHTENEIAGKSRGMLVTKSRLHCVKYKLEFDKQMKDMELPYRALVGFSGEVWDTDTHKKYTEKSMNGFSDSQTGDKLKEPHYRILIVNNKFQTGFDEPMLHTMYVDKKFGGLQCVQTLSRLNRKMRGKEATFVLDFVNEPEDVKEAFQPYYKETTLTEETDPHRLYNIEQEINKFNLFQEATVTEYVDVFYDENEPIEKLQGILDLVVEVWRECDEDEREEFRSHIQSFIRLYGYIAQIISFQDIDLEKLYIFLRGLNRKLPRREVEKLSDIFSSVDLECFKIQMIYDKENIPLEDIDGEVKGVGETGGSTPDEEPTDFLSEIINALNDSFAGEFTEEHKVHFEEMRKGIHEDIELREVMDGDNSPANREVMFRKVMDKISIRFVNDKLDFYKKINEEGRKELIFRKLYDDYCTALAG